MRMKLSPILNPKFRARGPNRILFLPAFATIHSSPSPHHPKRCSFPMANFSSAASPRLRLRGVVFDMDGTLTVPVIDFAAMYKSVLGPDEYDRIRAQSPSGIDILHIIQSWPPDKQRRAYEIIADFERQGLDRLRIMPGQFFPPFSTGLCLCIPSFTNAFFSAA